MGGGEGISTSDKLVDVTWRVEPPTEKQPNPAVVMDLQVQGRPTKVGEEPEIRASGQRTSVRSRRTFERPSTQVAKPLR